MEGEFSSNDEDLSLCKFGKIKFMIENNLIKYLNLLLKQFSVFDILKYKAEKKCDKKSY
jgi:hypothetical protein